MYNLIDYKQTKKKQLWLEERIYEKKQFVTCKILATIINLLYESFHFTASHDVTRAATAVPIF